MCYAMYRPPTSRKECAENHLVKHIWLLLEGVYAHMYMLTDMLKHAQLFPNNLSRLCVTFDH